MPALRKGLSELTPADFQTLIADEWSEDEQLEFKEALPSREGGSDRWMKDQKEFGDYARNQILAEVVAFANSYGGDVLLGIAETKDKPARAAEISCMPKCADLAHRLANAARQCIEPAIPSLQVVGVPFDAEGAGVVVLRTSASRLAPHRLIATRECYKRVRDETVKMSMREIQDLTISVGRGLEAVEKRLTELRQKFHLAYLLDEPTDVRNLRLAVQVTALPASASLTTDRVHNVSALSFPQREWTLKVKGLADEVQLPALLSWHVSRPMLRGTRAESTDALGAWFRELYCDGAISFGHFATCQKPVDSLSSDHVLYPELIPQLCLDAFAMADAFRTFVGSTAVEYAVNLEIVALPAVPTMPPGGRHRASAALFPVGSTLFPTYSLRGADERAELLSLIWRDFWHAAGKDSAQAIESIS